MAREFVSIIIPTHDREEILGWTLDSLSGLELPDDADIELLIVANACSDRTAELVEARRATYPFALRCLAEPIAGASRARNLGIAEARGTIFAFLDDDVQVNADWLVNMLKAYSKHPADLVSGRIDLWWRSVEPPEWLIAPIKNLLGYLNFGDEEFQFYDAYHTMSGNMSCRRHVFERAGNFNVNFGRTGKKLMAGEETEWMTRVVRAGFRMFYAPDMRIGHLVQSHRLTPEYLCPASYNEGKFGALAADPFGKREIYRFAVRNLPRVVRFVILEQLASARGDQGRKIALQFLRWQALGQLNGAWRRIGARLGTRLTRKESC